MTEPVQAAVAPDATPDERTMATLAHVLQLVGGWIAPLVIFLVKRQSRFITFHALQVLLLQVVFLFLTMIGMVGFFVALALGIAGGSFGGHGTSQGPPVFFFLSFGIFWGAIMLIWLIKLVLAIVYGIKAGHGEWAEYPILGRFARQILHIGPGGAVVNE